MLEPLLDDARALEHVLRAPRARNRRTAGSGGSAVPRGLTAARAAGARKLRISGRQPRDDLVGLGRRQDQRRQQADHGVVRDVDQQAGGERVLDQLAARPVELDADHQPHRRGPRPRPRRRPARAAGPRGSRSPCAKAFSIRPSLSTIAQRFQPGAHRQRSAAERRAVVARPEDAGRAPARRATRRSARRSPAPWRASSRPA